MKKLYYLAGLVPAALSSAVYAQESSSGAAVTVDSIVDTSQLRSTIITNITPWIAIGLGVAVSLYLVFLGWKKLKSMSKSN